MKISYRTHPILQFIKGERNDLKLDSRLPINQFQNIAKGIVYSTEKNRNDLLNNIVLISESFADAAMECRPKMIDNNLFKEIGDDLCGVILFKRNTFVYKLKRTMVNETVGGWETNIIVFVDDALELFAWDGFYKYASDGVLTFADGHTIRSAIIDYSEIIQMFLMFKKFADVETKELKAGQRTKGIDCKYINETKENITYLDSTWFTNLVKSDAFKVRGHFRLQPKKKNGEWTKELIWINDFQKEGYTRRAGKIIENV
jgi:hypothetical protein